MKKDCSRFAYLITGYIDRELSVIDNDEVKSHLAKCSECKAAYVQELSVKKLIKERLPLYEAPVTLQRRIRRQLVRNGDKPGFLQLVHSLFLYRPIAASFALAVIFCLAVLPIYQMTAYAPDLLTDPKERTNGVELKGNIVCLDCDLFAQESDLTLDPAIHRPGIVTEEESVWTFLNANVFIDLLHKKEVLNRKARVSGDLIQNARYIYVTDYELL